MNKLRKFGGTLRNNWKKTLFFGAAGVYGVKWYQKKQEDNEYMRGLAREALSYGSQPIHVDAANYAVTVILNPVSGGVKGRANYEKYCAPLLNLAGMKVSIIRTEGDGQAKDIMEIMKDANAVLIAGGDGTLMEAVTGLMRREDRDLAAKVPIGILPVGKTNSLAHKLFPGHDDQVRLMGDATMAVIRQCRKPVGVIEVENKKMGKKIYAMNQLELGAWKDTKLLLEKWFFSFNWVKNYIPQLLYARGYLTKHKEMLWDCDVDIQYVKSPCKEEEQIKEESVSVGTKENTKGVFSWFRGNRSAEVSKDTKQVPAEPMWTFLESGTFHGTGLKIQVEGDQLKADLYPAGISLEPFVSHGASVMRGRGPQVESQVITSPALLLTPGERREEEKEEKEEKEEGGAKVEKKICVDGDDIELSGPILVSYIRDRLSFFCDDSLAVKEDKPTEFRPTAKPRWSSMTSMGVTRTRTNL